MCGYIQSRIKFNFIFNGVLKLYLVKLNFNLLTDFSVVEFVPPGSLNVLVC